MSLATLAEVLHNARDGGFAVGAFNVSNLELAKAVIETAAELNSPVIVNCHPSEIRYAGIKPLTALVRALAEDVDVPVVLHLDHGNSFDIALSAIKTGFTSVMFDGSLLSFEDNIRETAKVVAVAKEHGVSVEGELGCIGGKELDISVHNEMLTDPLVAAEFVERTGITALAVAIGTSHGLYKQEPKIDIDRLIDIRSRLSIPLVLHGGSGTPDPIIRECIQHGVNKVNVATEMKMAYREAVLNFMLTSDIYEPHKIGLVGVNGAKAVIGQKMELFGSAGRAN